MTILMCRRPVDRRHDKAWVRAVVEVEQYRFNHNITDARTLIGPQPDDPDGRRAWRAAADTIDDTRHVLSLQQPRPTAPELPAIRATPQPDYPAPAPRVPELGLGL